MTLTAHDEDAITRRVNKRLPRLREQLASMHPAEAMALLGDLTVRAFHRLDMPQGMKMQMFDEWMGHVRDGVQRSWN